MTYPVMLSGARFTALVVGGGEVAARKTRALLDGGIGVRVVAPDICASLEELAERHPDLVLMKRAYQDEDIAGIPMVIAATSDPAVNGRVAQQARAAGLLVNVADDPDAGNFTTPSVHRAGDVIIAVSTGRTPGAAAAIRAEIAKRFDHRYATAVGALRGLRDRLLGDGRRAEWTRASRELIGDNFCADVEGGRIEPRVASWR